MLYILVILRPHIVILLLLLLSIKEAESFLCGFDWVFFLLKCFTFVFLWRLFFSNPVVFLQSAKMQCEHNISTFTGKVHCHNVGKIIPLMAYIFYYLLIIIDTITSKQRFNAQSNTNNRWNRHVFFIKNHKKSNEVKKKKKMLQVK